MKKTTALSVALLLLATTAALPAAAEHRGHDRGGHHGRHDDRGRHHDRDRHDDRGRYSDSRRDHHRDRRDGRHDHDRYAGGYYVVPAPRYVPPRGYRPGRWGVGYRLPPGYYASAYYVDPYAYRLRPPPRGHRWVRVDRDVYLVSVASGLISEVLYGIIR